jgi:hypothetical protein
MSSQAVPARRSEPPAELATGLGPAPGNPRNTVTVWEYRIIACSYPPKNDGEYTR